MTDQEHAKRIREAVQLLNLVVQAATEAGLSVGIASHDISTLGRPTTMLVDVTIERRTVVRL